MRILHVLDHSIPIQTGYTFRSRAILMHQRARGWETFHVTSPKHEIDLPSSLAMETVDGLDFYRTPLPQGIFAKLPALKELAFAQATSRRVLEVAKDIKPDVIHAHSPVLNAMAALPVGKQLGIPVVYEIRAFWEDASASHGTCKEGDLRYRLTQWLETRAVRKADAVTVICEGLRRDLIRRGIPAGKITPIPNAVDTSRFHGPLAPDPALVKELGLEGKQILGFIGSFYDYEGLDILIDAMPHILRQRDDVRLLMVGGGYCDTALRAQAQRLGLEDKVIFTGRVPHHEVERYYAITDIFVYPRKNIRLTDLVTPLKPLEAMAQHKLVAASDIGGHRELIRDGETGVLFPPDDPEKLADALVKLLGRRAEWPGFLERGRKFVEQERTWTNSIANYAGVYQRITGKPA